MGGGRVGIGLTLKKRSSGDLVVSRVKLRGPVSPPHINTEHKHRATHRPSCPWWHANRYLDTFTRVCVCQAAKEGSIQPGDVILSIDGLLAGGGGGALAAISMAMMGAPGSPLPLPPFPPGLSFA